MKKASKYGSWIEIPDIFMDMTRLLRRFPCEGTLRADEDFVEMQAWDEARKELLKRYDNEGGKADEY